MDPSLSCRSTTVSCYRSFTQPSKNWQYICGEKSYRHSTLVICCGEEYTQWKLLLRKPPDRKPSFATRFRKRRPRSTFRALSKVATFKSIPSSVYTNTNTNTTSLTAQVRAVK